MSRLHKWEEREDYKDPAPDSILSGLDMDSMSIFSKVPVVKELCKKRGYLRIPMFNQGYIGIASTYNSEHYQPVVDRIVQAIKTHQPILIWGDYDVDGMTATACLFKCLQATDSQGTINWGVPNRLTDGYGISAEKILQSTKPHSLIITVDNGIAEKGPCNVLKEVGHDVIITDHHPPEEEKIPEDVLICNPKVFADETNDEYMAPGVYVAAKIGLMVCRAMGIKGPEFIKLHHFCACLVAFGIVSDIIELNHLMRTQLLLGLAELGNTTHAGINGLLSLCNARENQDLTSTFLAYSVLPKLNAAGRMGIPEVGVNLLLLDTDNSLSCADSLLIANQLKYLNADRKIVENTIIREATKLAEEQIKVYSHSLVLYGKDWHPGVLGIVAARMAEAHTKPTIILADEGKTIKGSCRSVKGIDLRKILSKCKDNLISYGGHNVAAGIELSHDQLPLFRKQFDEEIQNSEVELTEIVTYDTTINIKTTYDARFQIFLSNFEPLGNLNPDLVFRINNVEMINSYVKNNCWYLIFADVDGFTLSASQFRPLEEYINMPQNKRFDILVSPSMIYYSGTSSMEWKIKSIKLLEETYADDSEGSDYTGAE